jgi:membrane-associated phospholipid phosphatase
LVTPSSFAHHPPPQTFLPLAWQPQWPRQRWWEYAITLGATGLLLYVEFGLEAPASARWEGPILFDEPIRDSLRLPSLAARQTADLASDVFWGIAFSIPLVDLLRVSLLPDRNLDLAWQLAAIDAQVLALVSLSTRLMLQLSRRKRPLEQECATNPDYDALCGANPSSFFSGHSSMAATAAGLTCAHHKFIPLYRYPAADLGVCLAASFFATFTGLMRIMADKHYATDVLVGGGLGFSVGYWLPQLLHYAWPPQGSAPGMSRKTFQAIIMPQASEEQLGLMLLGRF